MSWITRHFAHEYYDKYVAKATLQNGNVAPTLLVKNLLTTKNKLVLGCGAKTQPNAINVDFAKYPGVDLIWDLEVMPLPFPDSCVDEIFCNDIIEHLDDRFHFMEELWRIGKSNAKIHIRCPFYLGANLPGDCSHKFGFSKDSFNHFDHSTETWKRYKYTKCNFKINSSKRDGEDIDFLLTVIK